MGQRRVTRRPTTGPRPSTRAARRDKAAAAAVVRARLEAGDREAGPVEQLLTARQVRERLTLARHTVWRMVRDGRLPAPIKLTGARIAWRASDIAAWLESR